MCHIAVGYDTVNGVGLARAYFMNALLNLQHQEQGISWPVEYCCQRFKEYSVPGSELLAAFTCCTIRHFYYLYS
jgi:hypothetical protein